MVHARIATGAEQPINRDGAVSQYAGEEGDLVGQDGNGDWVQADADNGVAINATAVLAAPVTDPSNFTHEELRVIVEANRELVGESRIGGVRYGVLVENADEDWGFTPGEPVYLDTGGGYTQTKPSASGDLVQSVGVATGDGEVVWIQVANEYETVV
jgi:hypothetical protein